jgi:hypothetical protein
MRDPRTHVTTLEELVGFVAVPPSATAATLRCGGTARFRRQRPLPVSTPSPRWTPPGARLVSVVAKRGKLLFSVVSLRFRSREREMRPIRP